MNHFELVCILKPDLGKQSQDQVEENMKKYINESGGKIVDQEIWGLKNLAYPIKKSNKGYYIFIQFDIDAKELLNINKSLNLNENIIRHLSVKVENHEKQPTMMAQQKN